MGSGIYLELDGQPVDLADLSWFEKPPCGCAACGVHVAYSAHGGGEPLIVANEQQAIEHFWSNKKEREKYVDRLGFTVFLGKRTDVRELLVSECPHEPRFGVPPRPVVDGHEWAAVHAIGARSPLMHLVPTGAIEDARERRYGSDRGQPLCGGKRAFHWKTEWYALDGKVECSRCWKAAEKSLAVTP